MFQGPCNCLKKTIYIGGGFVDRPNKLKALFTIIPSFIQKVICKRKNKIKHVDICSIQGMAVKVCKSAHISTRLKYFWLKNVLEDWNDLV